LVASTAINDKTYTIEPVSTGKISDIMIETSYLSLLTTAPGIVIDFMAQGANITDFINIINSGSFPSGVTKHNILTVSSKPRNKRVMEVLE
jgi:ABC-type phosphate transport system ATPase subunit